MILISFGTRPEYIKLKPLMDKMKGVLEYKVLFTGQHQDLVDEDNSEITYTVNITNDRNRLDSIVTSIMNAIDFKQEGITAVIVQGDTTSAYAMALSAFHHQIPVIHLEAGLRTYNLTEPYPEEANRQMISRIASIHLCPTLLAKKRLTQELISGRVKVVGNTVLDNLSDIKTCNKKQVLLTMHRRENHHNIQQWFRELDSLAITHSEYLFTLPIHPNPNVKKHIGIFKHINIVEPMSYKDLIAYLSNSSFVITDSGGIQEEAAFLKKPCLVCRKETERVEGLGNFSLLCPEPKLLHKKFKELNILPMSGPCPYGDGYACEKIIKVLLEHKG